ncbi:hypothetical protein BT93_L3977 [Corymbia citriodora subsp. variegata]|uniref:Uncharacterized protein n=1 Tax=Corymbia citriodora subsp. variegata TaxID=360336 RepID=A0A8T0CGF4_CORYI|nr:hypothetical protein BT93_L3977 [Corymbia citriodora subsp. variegata]
MVPKNIIPVLARRRGGDARPYRKSLPLFFSFPKNDLGRLLLSSLREQCPATAKSTGLSCLRFFRYLYSEGSSSVSNVAAVSSSRVPPLPSDSESSVPRRGSG